MRKIKSAFVGVDQGSVHLFSDYDTGGPMWSHTGEREVAKRIMFSEPFARPPAVTLQIAMLDSHSDHFLRMSYYVRCDLRGLYAGVQNVVRHTFGAGENVMAGDW